MLTFNFWVLYTFLEKDKKNVYLAMFSPIMLKTHFFQAYR